MVSTIAIAGISSHLALLIAEDLLKQPDVKLRGSCRDLTKLPQWIRESDRVTLVQTGPYDTGNLRSLIKGSDVVICCYFPDNEIMFQGQKLLVDLCEEERVSRYIARDYTLDYTKINYGDMPVKDPMKQIKAYVETTSHFKGVHILVGLFLEPYWQMVVPSDPETKTLRTWVSKDAKLELTSYRTCAQYAAGVALDDSATGMVKLKCYPQPQNAFLYLHGPCRAQVS